MGTSQGLEDKLLDIAVWVDDNKYLSSIKNAFTALMPFIIVGSMGTLFNALIASKTTGLAIWFPVLNNLAPAFNALNFCTMSFMTIPVIFMIALNIARANKGHQQATGVLAVVAYISMVPNTVATFLENGTATNLSAMLTTTFAAQGLFVGMLTALIISELFNVFCKIDAIKIKMPPSVPKGIADAFNMLVPILFVLMISSLFGIFFHMLTGYYINEWIYTVMQVPLEALFNTPAGIIGLVIVSQVFWFLGIHGGLVISPVRNPIMVAALAANTAAVSSGQTPTAVLTQGFWLNFIVVGGAGMILSFIIALFIFSKRDDHRSIAKLAFVPALCGVSEPVVFGLPLILNPTFAIPFIFNSSIACAIALFATNIGFLPCNAVDIPFGLPIVISAFISHGWQGIVVQLICIAVTTLCWIPFVRISNKLADKEVAEAK